MNSNNVVEVNAEGTATKKMSKYDWLFEKSNAKIVNPRSSSKNRNNNNNNKTTSERQHTAKCKQSRNPPNHPSPWCNDIEADTNVTIFDDINYLFINDTFPARKKANQDVSNTTTTSTSTAFLSSFLPTTTSLRGCLPRAAKQKPPLRTVLTSDDDDDFLPSTRNKNTQQWQTKLIDYMPNNPEKKTNSFYGHNKKVETIAKKATVQQTLAESLFDKARNMFAPKKAEIKPIEIEDTTPREKQQTADSTKQDKVGCPMCNVKFPQKDIETHAAACDGPVNTRQNSQTNSQEGSGAAYDENKWMEACKTQGDSSGDLKRKFIQNESIAPVKPKNPWQFNSEEEETKQKRQKRKHMALPKPNTKADRGKRTKLTSRPAKTISELLIDVDHLGVNEGSPKSKEDRDIYKSYQANGMRTFGSNKEDSQQEVNSCVRCFLEFETLQGFKEHTNKCLEETTLGGAGVS